MKQCDGSVEIVSTTPATELNRKKRQISILRELFEVFLDKCLGICHRNNNKILIQYS